MYGYIPCVFVFNNDNKIYQEKTDKIEKRSEQIDSYNDR